MKSSWTVCHGHFCLAYASLILKFWLILLKTVKCEQFLLELFQCKAWLCLVRQLAAQGEWISVKQSSPFLPVLEENGFISFTICSMWIRIYLRVQTEMWRSIVISYSAEIVHSPWKSWSVVMYLPSITSMNNQLLLLHLYYYFYIRSMWTG